MQAVKDARAIFWKHLRKIQFNVAVPEESDFVHVGTTRENIEFLTEPSKWYDRLQLAPHVQRYSSFLSFIHSLVILRMKKLLSKLL